MITFIAVFNKLVTTDFASLSLFKVDMQAVECELCIQAYAQV